MTIILRGLGAAIWWSFLFVDYVWGDYQLSRWFIAFILGMTALQFVIKLMDAWSER